MTDVYSKEKRSEIMSRVKNSRTLPENIVAKLLKEIGIRCRRNVKTLPGKPDFVIYSRKLAVFVNGCFWHGHPNCKRSVLPKTNKKFWKAKIDNNIKRDEKVSRLLRKDGWRVMTIWQCRLNNPGRVLNRLKNMLSI